MSTDDRCEFMWLTNNRYIGEDHRCCRLVHEDDRHGCVCGEQYRGDGLSARLAGAERQVADARPAEVLTRLALSEYRDLRKKAMATYETPNGPLFTSVVHQCCEDVVELRRQVAAIRAAEVKLADNGEAVRVIYHDQDGRQVVDLYPKEFTNRKGWESAERFAGWLRAALGVTPTEPGECQECGNVHNWPPCTSPAPTEPPAPTERRMSLIEEMESMVSGRLALARARYEAAQEAFNEAVAEGRDVDEVRIRRSRPRPQRPGAVPVDEPPAEPPQIRSDPRLMSNPEGDKRILRRAQELAAERNAALSSPAEPEEQQ